MSHGERGAVLSIALFSAFVNLLLMTGPMFMLQVYDRILPAHSVPSLLSMFLIVVFLFAVLGVLDYMRGRLMARLAARFRLRAEEPVFRAMLAAPRDQAGRATLDDLDAVQGLVSSRVGLAIFDLPWSPLFFSAIFLFHPDLGLLALAGTGILVILALVGRGLARRGRDLSGPSQAQARRLSTYLQDEAELIRALGMQGNGFHRWQATRHAALEAELWTSDRSAIVSEASRAFRHLLQSAMLALGALVVLRGEMTPGAMIAGSILMGRALGPIESVIGAWGQIEAARQAWQRLKPTLARPGGTARLPLPRPKGLLDVRELSVVPPAGNAPVLRLLSFSVRPGEALGVIGQSGAGKTSLARALCGLWAPTTGQIRLDGARLDRYDTDQLGTLIGYLPQQVSLFAGTLGENIARLDPNATMEGITRAAKCAGIHQMILDLPDGYETRVSMLGGQLSGGQVQRVGLARAVYGDPVLLILDEPNANLDAQGIQALNSAIQAMKAAGCSVVIMSHRPSGIAECDTLMMLDRGLCRALGPREAVLAETVRNAREIGMVSQMASAAPPPREAAGRGPNPQGSDPQRAERGSPRAGSAT